MTNAAGQPQFPQFDIHHRLSLCLEQSGVTADEMADALGVHENTIWNYASGRRIPKRGAIKAWAMRCGMPDMWLWIETGIEEFPTPDPDGPRSRWTPELVPDQDVIRPFRQVQRLARVS